MDACDNDVELGQESFFLVERAIFQDVDLNAGQKAKRRQLLVECRDHLELFFEAFRAQPVGDTEAGAVICKNKIVMAELGRCLGHLEDRAPAVGPVRVAVAVTLERPAESERPGAERHGLDCFQLLEIAR